MELATNRLKLRQWRASDREPFAALNADPLVMEYFPRTITRAESDDMVERLRTAIETDGYGLWAVEVTGTADFIGFVGLQEVRFDAAFTPAVELGWRLAVSFWGQGYATEAAQAAVRFGFDTLGLDELVSFTTRTNQRSQAVMRRLGMSRNPADDFIHEGIEGPLRHHVLYRLPAPTASNPAHGAT